MPQKVPTWEMRASSLALFFAALLPAIFSCNGEIGPGGSSAGNNMGVNGAPGAGGPAEQGLLGATAQDCAPSPPQPITRVARLTHAQYDNTVRDLLAVATALR